MKRTCIVATLALLVALAPGLQARDDEQVTRLRQQQNLISSINLLNGLHLSGEQVRRLLEINLEAEALRNGYNAANAEKMAEAERLYRELEESFAQDRPAPEESERIAQQLHVQLIEAERAYTEHIAELGNEIEAMLTEGQRRTLVEFKPCLIPPRDLREPSRAGQASPTSGGIKILERYREVMQRAEEIKKQGWQRSAEHSSSYYARPAAASSRRYYAANRAREVFAERFFPRYFERIEFIVGEMSESEKRAERERVMAILDRAAAMSEEDYSLNCEALGAELMAPVEREEAELRDARITLASRRGMPGRAANFLIKKNLIPILEQRAAQYAATPD